MKMAKSLFLGTAAGIVAVAGAQAADLPVKAAPVEYVKICPTSLYGAGFYYIPGTQTCLKIGGYVRAEINFNAGGSHNPNFAKQWIRTEDTHTWRTRGYLTFDAYTATEYGKLRAYTAIYGDYTNGTQTGLPVGSSNFALDRAYIQFAGFTFGKVTTAYVTPWTALPGSSFSRLFGGDGIGSGVNGIHYTAQFGNGVSATIALEEAIYRRGAGGGIWNQASTVLVGTTSGATLGGATSNGGLRFPDIVGNIRVDQAWGTAFVSAIASQQFPAYYALATTAGASNSGTPGSEWGYGFTGGLNVKLPQLGAGDQAWIQASWTKGIVGTLTGVSNPGGFSNTSGSDVTYQSVALGYIVNGVYGPPGAVPGYAGSLELTSGWGINGGIEHYWVPGKLRSSLFAGYATFNYSATANALMCSRVVFTAGSVCDWDLSVWNLGSRSVWTPVAGLDFIAEIAYSAIDQSHSGAVAANNATTNSGGLIPLIKPSWTTYELKDQGVWSGLIRVQRNW